MELLRVRLGKRSLEVDSLNRPSVADKTAWGETYLANYNAISAFFWFNIPLRLIQIHNRFGAHQVYDGTVDYVKYVQAMAVLEIFHSAIGSHLCTRKMLM